MAIESDIEEYFSGNDVVLHFTTIDEDTADALDLSGATAIDFMVAKKASASTALISKSLANGISIVSAAEGTFDVTLSDSDTEALKGDYYYEVRLTNSLGNKITLAYGKFSITENLIRT